MALSDGLQHYYAFEGDATDSRGGANLTEVNSPTYASSSDMGGGSSDGQAVQFPGTAHMTGVAGEHGISGDFTMAFQVFLDTSGGGADPVWSIVNRYDGAWSLGNKEYLIQVQNTGTLQWFVFDTADNFTSVTLSLSTDSWGTVFAQYDSTTKKTGLYFNTGSLTESTTALVGAAHNSATSSLNVGALPGISPDPYYGNSRLDRLTFWNRLLTSEERTAFHNKENPLPPPCSKPNLSIGVSL